MVFLATRENHHSQPWNEEMKDYPEPAIQWCQQEISKLYVLPATKTRKLAIEVLEIMNYHGDNPAESIHPFDIIDVIVNSDAL
jgi:hypothetical protein